VQIMTSRILVLDGVRGRWRRDRRGRRLHLRREERTPRHRGTAGRLCARTLHRLYARLRYRLSRGRVRRCGRDAGLARGRLRRPRLTCGLTRRLACGLTRWLACGLTRWLACGLTRLGLRGRDGLGDRGAREREGRDERADGDAEAVVVLL